MRKTYGNTWWGQQFLQALERIDFSNRLPRGRTYANKGAVLSVDIKGATVSAKVQGSRKSPYKQTISLHPFSSIARQDVVQMVANHPYLLSQLLNRQIPPELATELREIGIELFPKSWRDVKATCSCPDYAVPCKHLAAVFYLLANEVDKSPFLLFELRGLDLLTELEARGHTSSESRNSQVPTWEQFIRQEPDLSPSVDVSTTLAALNFSKIPECRDKLLRLLDPRPAFYPAKDFHKLLERWYTKIGRLESTYQGPNVMVEFPYDLEGLTIALDEVLQVTSVIQHRGIAGQESVPISMRKFIGGLEQMELHHPVPVLRYLKALWQFARHLIAQGGMIPQLIGLPKDQVLLRWVPATLDPVVKSLFQVFVAGWPSELQLIQRVKKDTRYLDKAGQVRFLLSLMIEEVARFETLIDDWDDVTDFFFETFTFKPQGFGDAETLKAIWQWLQRFELGDRDNAIVLKIEEDEPGFSLSFWVENKQDSLAPFQSLEDLFSGEQSQQATLRLMQDLASLTPFLPQVSEIINSKGKQAIKLSGERFVAVLTETLPAFELMGIRILLPKALKRVLRPQATLEIQEFGNPHAAQSFLNLKEMLQFQWKVAIGDQFLDPREFLRQVNQMRGLIKIQDSYVLIDDKEMKTLLRKLDEEPKVSPETVLQVGLTESYDGGPAKLSKKAQKIIRELVEQEAIAPPETLQATLREYQVRGFSWLHKNDRVGFGSILADDMGLGKTIQVISFLASLKDTGQLDKQKALVVVPTSLLSNWQREIQKFAPHLQAFIFHGPTRKLDLEGVDVVLTTYGVARSDQAMLTKIRWRMLIIDEAQAIKNPGTAQTKAIKSLKARSRIAMSGTPVENRLSEYWSIFDFANHGYLSS
ncbi:MAG: SNF2-related protein, partial [Bacteroidia bacterium]|nr:SNF2-related protein [Bacteroidia bacterium]